MFLEYPVLNLCYICLSILFPTIAVPMTSSIIANQSQLEIKNFKLKHLCIHYT